MHRITPVWVWLPQVGVAYSSGCDYLQCVDSSSGCDYPQCVASSSGCDYYQWVLLPPVGVATSSGCEMGMTIF